MQKLLTITKHKFWLLSILLVCIHSIMLAQTTTPEPTATPDFPIFRYTIDGLRAREYPGGIIQYQSTQSINESYTRYLINYPSDGLTISATMNVPVGTGPFPVIVMLHGYYDRVGYWSGLGTSDEADYLARRGYLTIAPDFRTWGASDMAANLFASGLVTDTLNLIGSLSSLPQADTTRVGIWGHSMGGGVATKALVIDPRIRVGVLYAPNSADDADLIDRWGFACLPGQSEAAGDKCNPADVLTPDLPQTVVNAYITAATDPNMLQLIAPIYHLEQINAPIQIHIGTADGAALAQTPPEWSEKLYLALESAEKNVDFHTYIGQGHFLRGQSWVTMMERAQNFYDEHLEPLPTTP